MVTHATPAVDSSSNLTMSLDCCLEETIKCDVLNFFMYYWLHVWRTYLNALPPIKTTSALSTYCNIIKIDPF